ncbi:MAG: nucleotidyltransferase family protein [Proteobacteria bacterium]|nr:nucleotidyltransferase family protein [Pseudomonadota bacterium]
MLPVAILMGGLATRLRPITLTIPKALVEVSGKPFVHRQLDYLRGQGVRRVVLLIGHLGEQIEASVGDGSAFGIEVAYSPDGPTRLGTAGALRRALPFLGPAFFVLYGDSFLPIDFAPAQAAFHASGKLALMTVLENADRWDKSNAYYRDDVVIEYNKAAPRPEMRHIDYGLSVFTDGALRDVPEGQPVDLATVCHRLSIAGQLAGYEVTNRFYEIGSPEGLRETTNYFAVKEK